MNKGNCLSGHARGSLALFGSTYDEVPGFHWGKGSSWGDKECYEGGILSSIIWLFYSWLLPQFERIEWGYTLVLYMPFVRSKLLSYNMPVSSYVANVFPSLNILSSITPSFISAQHFYYMMPYILLSQALIIR